MVMPKERMSTEGERDSKFLSCLTGAQYVHPCTVTIDSVLANLKTQNAFLFPVHAMFRHDCPLAVNPASTPWRIEKINLERFSTYWYDQFCGIYLGCCAAEFGSSGGTYELPCIFTMLLKCQVQLLLHI